MSSSLIEPTVVAAVPDAVMTVQGLTKLFPAKRTGLTGARRWIHAVEDVSFTLKRGRILALVGESGSGKSTIARLLARLYPATSGSVHFDGQDILSLRRRDDLLRYRSRVQMVFQDPFGSLNPTQTIAHHIERPLLIHHQVANQRAARERVHALLQTVGLTPPDEVSRKLPHQLSGGQRQRVSFARALGVNPQIILADEPISMLDVSIRMGILNLMAKLRDESGLSYLYITHDLASARYIANEVMVLYAGQVMETAPCEDLMKEPLHPYTQLLLSAVPNPQRVRAAAKVDARGEIPVIVDPQPGCRFANRCPRVMDICRTTDPAWIQARPQHWTRCHLYGPGAEGARHTVV